MNYFARQQKLVGEQGIKRLTCAHVAVFGVGGVGGHAAEALARAAVGSVTIVDKEDVEASNLNRQIIAMRSTIGIPKVDAMKSRIKDINPVCKVTAKKIFVNSENIAGLLDGITYAVDAVDNVSAKLAIIQECVKRGIPVISSMGAGNRLAGSFCVMDISQTKDDALARVMRRELKKRGIENMKVVCCNDKGLITPSPGEPISSISYMPGLCGLTIAGEVIRDIIRGEKA